MELTFTISLQKWDWLAGEVVTSPTNDEEIFLLFHFVCLFLSNFIIQFTKEKEREKETHKYILYSQISWYRLAFITEGPIIIIFLVARVQLYVPHHVNIKKLNLNPIFFWHKFFWNIIKCNKFYHIPFAI